MTATNFSPTTAAASPAVGEPITSPRIWPYVLALTALASAAPVALVLSLPT